MDNQFDVSEIDKLLGKNIHVIAFGASYMGRLTKVDHEKDAIILTDGKDTVILDLDRVESLQEA